MKVVSIDPKEKEKQKIKNDLLEVLDEMRTQIEDGNILEFVAVSICNDGECQIHAKVIDLPTGIGLFEIGKHMMIQQEAY
jgi:hypothetical protein